MNRLADKIPVEPLSEERRARLEDAVASVFVRARVAGAPRARRWPWLLAPVAVAAAVALALTARGRDDRAAIVVEVAPPAIVDAQPMRVVTPPGAGVRVPLGDAIVDVAGDSAVEIATGDATEVRLLRGAVTCDVEPRGDRAPFAVVAGDVSVTVVGTRFEVARADAVRVAVDHGVVRVASPSGTAELTAGQTWTSAPQPPASLPRWARAALTDPEPVAAVDDKPRRPRKPTTPPPITDEPAPLPQPRRPRGSMRNEAFTAAAAAEADGDLARAITEYARALRDAPAGSPEAQYALYSMAFLANASGDHATALRRAEAYDRAYPRGIYAKDALWLRIYVHHTRGDHARVRALAERYIDRFGLDKYGIAANRLLEQ